MRDPSQNPTTPTDAARRGSSGFGIDRLDGFRIVTAGARENSAEETRGRGYVDEGDVAGAWLRKHDPTGHGAKRKPGPAASAAA